MDNVQMHKGDRVQRPIRKHKYVGHCVCGNFSPHVVSRVKGICLECGQPLRPEVTYKERMDADIQRVKTSLLNLLQRRYPDNWREKLAEIVA